MPYHLAIAPKKLERITRLELATSTLDKADAGFVFYLVGGFIFFNENRVHTLIKFKAFRCLSLIHIYR